MKISIIIPVFNEEKTIAATLHRVSQLSIPNVLIEIIVVDDGSRDSSKFKISSFAKSLKDRKDLSIRDLKIFRHKANFGKGQAIRTGITYASGEYILIQDADSEYNTDDIVRLVGPILDGKAQVVYGTRLTRLPKLADEVRSGLLFRHYLGNKLLSFITSLLYRQWITDMETGYKIFPRKAMLSIKLNAKGFEFEPEITAKLIKAGYKIIEIPITTIPRSYQDGKKINTIKDGIKALQALFFYRFRD